MVQLVRTALDNCDGDEASYPITSAAVPDYTDQQLPASVASDGEVVGKVDRSVGLSMIYKSVVNSYYRRI